MNRLPPDPKRPDARGAAPRRRGRGQRRLQGLAYVAVAAGALAAAGLQPPHTAAVEVGTVIVATTAGGELAWPSGGRPAAAR